MGSGEGEGPNGAAADLGEAWLDDPKTEAGNGVAKMAGGDPTSPNGFGAPASASNPTVPMSVVPHNAAHGDNGTKRPTEPPRAAGPVAGEPDPGQTLVDAPTPQISIPPAAAPSTTSIPETPVTPLDLRVPHPSQPSEPVLAAQSSFTSQPPRVSQPPPPAQAPLPSLPPPPAVERTMLPPIAASLPDLPAIASAPDAPPTRPAHQPHTPEETARLQSLIAAYDKEAKAIGNKPRAASLYLEIGRIWEEQLGKQRNAAMCYQRAFHLNSRDLAVLHASRRLFTEVENWGMVVQILQAEIDATEDRERRAALLAEKGTILEEKLKNPEEAQKALKEALEVWPMEPLALHGLEQIHLARRDWRALYGVYQRALGVAKAPERRLPLLIAAGQVAEDRLDDLAGAIAHYDEVVQIDPKNALALAALRRLNQRAERWPELINVLKLSAEAADTPERATGFLVAAARIDYERLDAPDKALLSLLKALEHSPRDLLVLREIEWLYDVNERHEDVAKVLKRELDVVAEVRDRVPILFRLGSLLEERLDRPEDAAGIIREAVELLPDYIPAVQALGRLYARTGQWPELALLFERELARERDPGVRASLLFKLAELYEARLGKEDDAIKLLQELLSATPAWPPALHDLERLYEKRERWGELVALLESQLQLTEEKDHRVFLLERIARLAEEKLGALDQAVLAHERILETAPRRLDSIRTLARLGARRERWMDVLRAYELEEEATSDPNDVVAIVHRAGLVHEEKRADIPAAIACYEKALALSPAYLPALRSLGCLYQKQERWPELIAMYRRELDVARSDDQAIGLLFRIGEIYSEEIGDDAEAERIYDEILKRRPESLPAMEALAEIQIRQGDFEKLARILVRQSKTLESPEEKARPLLRAAELHEQKLQQLDRAAELYQEVLALGQSQDTAVEGLVRIFSAAGLWEALKRALVSAAAVSADPKTRAAMLVRCAEIALDKLDKPERAIEHLEAALAAMPNDRSILAQLERVYVERRDWPRAIATGESLAEIEPDPRMYAARQVRIAAMKESLLDPPRSGTENFRKALERVPGYPAAMRAMELAYRSAGAWDGLVALYKREAMVTPEPERRANLFLRAADVAENRLGKDDVADPLYQSAIEVAPGHIPAIRGRRRIAERRGDTAGVLACILAEGEATADNDRARDLLFEAGDWYQNKQKDLDRAVDAFQKVLSRSPKHAPAIERLTQIHKQRGDVKAYADLLVTTAGASESADEQAKAYLEAARIAQDNLQDHAGAIRHLRAVLERDKGNAEALERLGPLLYEARQWEDAVDVFQRMLVVSKQPKAIARALQSLGVIFQDHKVDLVKAVQSFQGAVQADPSDHESLRRLAKVYREAQDWSSAVNVLLRLAEVQQVAQERVETLLELGRIYEEAFRDLDNATLATRKALEMEPSNQRVIQRLIELQERRGDWKAVAETTEQFLRGLVDVDKSQAVPFHLRMASIYESKLNDDAKATSELRHVLEGDPQNPQALEALARLYAKSTTTFPQAVDIHRRLLRLDPFRVESYHEMRRMFERRGEYDKQFVICEILVFLRAQLPEEDLTFHEFKDKVAPRAQATLSHEDHERLITHPDEKGIPRHILEALATELYRAFPGEIGPYELSKPDRHGPRSDHPIRRLADELARVLGSPLADLWVTRKFPLGVFVENVEPPALIVGANVGLRMQDKEQRFRIGRELERLKGGHFLFKHLGAPELSALVWATASIVKPDIHAPPEVRASDLEQMKAKVVRSISRKARKAIEDVGPRIGTLRFDPVKHMAGAVHTANRAGLVVTNDIEVALRAIAKDAGVVKSVFADAAGAAETMGNLPEVRELLAYAVSEEYFAARARLGFSIQT